jgi:hypothetical protein
MHLTVGACAIFDSQERMRERARACTCFNCCFRETASPWTLSRAFAGPCIRPDTRARTHTHIHQNPRFGVPGTRTLQEETGGICSSVSCSSTRRNPTSGTSTCPDVRSELEQRRASSTPSSTASHASDSNRFAFHLDDLCQCIQRCAAAVWLPPPSHACLPLRAGANGRKRKHSRVCNRSYPSTKPILSNRRSYPSMKPILSNPKHSRLSNLVNFVNN